MEAANLKARLTAGHAVLGTFVKIPAPELLEILGAAGFDFVILDAEHGALTSREIEQLVRAADSVGMAAMVRVAGAGRADILHALDVGAAGVQVPMVDSAADAAAVVRYARYAPLGRRGLALSHRAARYGALPAPTYTAESNSRVLVAAQIETGDGVQAAAAIAAQPGIDVLFVGPTDLAQSLGVLDQPGAPELREAAAAVYAAAGRHGKVAGTLVSSAEAAQAALAQGVRYVVWGTEIGLLAGAARGVLQQWSQVNHSKG